MSEAQRVSFPQNWSAYNAAQTREIPLLEVLLEELTSTVETPPQERGRPRTPYSTALYCAIRKVHSQMSLRRAQGLLGPDAPHFNTASKILNREDVTPILHDLVARSAAPLAGIEHDLAVDSTGFRSTSYGLYRSFKYGESREAKWLKAHLAVGTNTHVIAAVIVTDRDGADSPQFQPLLRRVHGGGFRMENVYADKAYPSRENYNTAATFGATAYIPFRSNMTGRTRNSPAWRRAFHLFQANPEAFYKEYHARSNVEAGIAAIKRKLGETLKSKNRVAQENELLAKIIAYNIGVVIHEAHLRGLDILHQNPGACTQSRLMEGL